MCSKLSFRCLVTVLLVALTWEVSKHIERARLLRIVEVMREDGYASEE